jgi:hypothetical protein
MHTVRGQDWYLAYDLDVVQIVDAHRTAVAMGQGPIDISGWWDGSRECFAGLWTRDGAGGGDGSPDWYRGIGIDQYERIVGPSTAGDAGFRPVRQHFYNTPDGVHLASIWRDRTTRWTARHGMSPVEFEAECEFSQRQGLRLTDVSGYEQNGQPRYAAVWEEAQGDNPTVGAVRHDQRHPDLVKDFVELVRDGYLPLKITGFVVQNGCYYASVWEKSRQGAIQVRRRDDVPIRRFGKECAELVKAGYRPLQLAGYTSIAGPRLGAIFNSVDGNIAAVHGADPNALRLSVIESNEKQRNIAAERKRHLDAEAKRRARYEREQLRIAEKQRRRAEAAAEGKRQEADAERKRQEAGAERKQQEPKGAVVSAIAVAPGEAATTVHVSAARPTEQVQVALEAALRPVSDFVEGAVAALVIGAARNHGIDISSTDKLAALVTARDVARIREEIAATIQSHGAAEFHAFALHLEDAWRLRKGPLHVDIEGAITLLEISARAQYDATRLSLSAFFESVTARLTGSAAVGVDGLGKAWAGGSLSGPGASGGVFLGLGSGAGAQFGVSYGRAEAVAGLEILGQQTQMGIGVSAGFELGLQLSATVSVRLGPLAASVPNVPLAAVTWAGGALADLVSDPEKTVVRAVKDVAGTVEDIVGFLGDLAEGAAGFGEAVIEGISDLLGSTRQAGANVVTKAETAADGRRVKHHETFEGPNSTWLLVGNAGIDVGKGYAAHGSNNAWVRGAHGVHVIAAFFDVMRTAPYTLTMSVQTSTSPVMFVVGVREASGLDAGGALMKEELHRDEWTEYHRTELKFTTTSTGRILVYAGLLGTGADTWCRIDEVRLDTNTVYFD